MVGVEAKVPCPPAPATLGSPPAPGRRTIGGLDIIKRNPIVSVPDRKTKRFRVRGRYRPVELVFVSEELEKLGYKRTNSNKDWDIIWTVRMVREEFAILTPFQKVNFLPGMHFICSKDLLHKSICSSRSKWMKSLENSEDSRVLELARCNFWPVGFNLEIPEQFDTLAAMFSSNDDLLYIIKKPFSSCGRGVSIIHSYDQLMKIKEEEEYQPLSKVKPLAQQYIANVKLFDGFKFSIRMYVALTGVDPLTVYVFNNGLLRICSKRYSLDKESMNDDFIHIDSIAININNQNPEQVTDTLKHEGLRCDIQSYLKILEDEFPKEVVNQMWQQMKEIAAISILSAEHPLSHAVTSVCKQRSDRTHGFEIFGYDILIDQNLKPWLLEINHTPSLEPLTRLENDVKRNMIHDLFQLVDITAERRILLVSETDRLWRIIQTIQEHLNANRQLACILNNKSLSSIDFHQFDRTLVYILVQLELNEQNCGGYERVLPDPSFLPFTAKKPKTLFVSEWIKAGLSILKDVYLTETEERIFSDDENYCN